VGCVGIIGPDARAASAATSCSGPLDAGQIRVVVVVDPGDGGGFAPSATCLVVAEDGTHNMGSRVLAQRATQLGRPGPRYAGSGLLCGLDGFPTDACPQNGGSTYDYWAYFNPSGGGWSYGSDNPFSRRMHDGEIMGWRYNTGSSESQAASPRIAPSSSLFPPLEAPAPPPPAVVPPAAGGSGSTGSSTGGGYTGPAASSADGTAADPAATDPAAADTATPSNVTDTTASATPDASADGDEELAAAPASSSSSDAGRWIGVALVIPVIGALGVGAVVRGRTRTRP
jgi:hypothetical protein